MPKRYQGNSGRYDWLGPPPGSAPPPPQQPFEPPPEHHAPPPPPVHAQGGEHAAPSGALGLQLLPKLLRELETEDFILLLLCFFRHYPYGRNFPAGAGKKMNLLKSLAEKLQKKQ